MKVVLGIGNFGKKYTGTRHNVGFEVLDGLKTSLGKAKEVWKKSDSLKAEILSTDGVLLAKPLTYVNETRLAIGAILGKYQNLTPSDFLLVCDDVNLDFGKLRLRDSGSAGGHHGLESAIQAFGSDEFSRLRVGVRNEVMPQDLTGFVLDCFLPEEQKKLPEILEKAVCVCQDWAAQGFDAALKRLSQLQSIKEK